MDMEMVLIVLGLGMIVMAIVEILVEAYLVKVSLQEAGEELIKAYLQEVKEAEEDE